MPDDPRWPRASAWLAGDHHEDAAGRLAVLGAPVRLGSITPGRCDLAPGAIRSALERYTTFDMDAGVDVRALRVRDHGDLDLADASPEGAFAPLADAVREALGGAEALVLLGGDNSVTRAGCHGAGDSLSGVGLLTLDAHLDLRDLDTGLSNGNPVRALLADGLPGSQIVQVGIQPFANSAAYAATALEAGITVIGIDDVRLRGIDAVIDEALSRLARISPAIYVDLDLDVLDRVFSPATPGSRPNGLTPWETRRAARRCGLEPRVRVLDLVEVDPTRDVADATVLAAAQCLLSFASGVVGRDAIR